MRNCIEFSARFLVHNTILNGFFFCYSPLMGYYTKINLRLHHAWHSLCCRVKPFNYTGERLSATLIKNLIYSRYVYSWNFSHAQSFFIPNHYCVNIVNCVFYVIITVRQKLLYKMYYSLQKNINIIIFYPSLSDKANKLNKEILNINCECEQVKNPL